MGWFDWLWSSASPVNLSGDFVWMNEAAKFKGIADRVREANTCAATLVVAHFSDSLQRLREALASDIHQGTLLVVSSGEFREFHGANNGFEETDVVRLIVAERHFLRRHDQQLLDFAERLGCRCEVEYHLSFDDPLLQEFAGDWVKSILEKLGMEEHEPIESGMVRRRIQEVQNQWAQRVTMERPADTASQWRELNQPAS